jgi:hypothetical protein
MTGDDSVNDASYSGSRNAWNVASRPCAVPGQSRLQMTPA